MKALCIAMVAGGLLIPVVGQADYYSYETEEGTLAFADDIERVPKRYQKDVKQQAERSLRDYARATLVPRGASRSAAPTAFEREQLEATVPTPIEAPVADPVVTVSSNPAVTVIRSSRLDIEPVLIERTTEWRWINGSFIPHTVVRRNREIVSIIRLR